MKHLFFSATCVFLFSLLEAQDLSKVERKILGEVEKNNEEALALLEKVVNINSGTNNHEGVQLVGDEFMQAFEDIDFATTWIEMPTDVERAGHFLAEKSGDKGKRILIIGHLDTVFEEDSPFQKWEVQGDTIAYGPGANDMKGGDVMALYALKALHSLDLLKDAQIVVIYTGDEEKTGMPLSISRRDLIEAAKRSDIALGFETSSGFNYATVARRGSSGWSLEVTGTRAHSSGIFNERVGSGAIFEIARILHRFHEEVKGEEYLTFNPGIILGGTTIEYDPTLNQGEVFGKSNVVAQTARVSGGLRFISEEQQVKARTKMREIVNESLPQTHSEITFTDSYPAMGPTPGNLKLLQLLNQVSLDLGQGEVAAYDPGRRGGRYLFCGPICRWFGRIRCNGRRSSHS